MTRPGATGERSIVTFLFAVLAFSPPVLSIFSAEVFVFGVPLLFLYLFVVWAAIVALVAWIADFGGGGAAARAAARRQDPER